MTSRKVNNLQNIKTNGEHQYDFQKSVFMTAFLQAMNNTKEEVVKDYNNITNVYKKKLQENHLKRVNVNGLLDTINNLQNVTGKEYKRMKMIQQSMEKCIQQQNSYVKNCHDMMKGYDNSCAIIENLINVAEKSAEKKIANKRSNSLAVEIGKKNEKKRRDILKFALS